jgi:hypothetical protein
MAGQGGGAWAKHGIGLPIYERKLIFGNRKYVTTWSRSTSLNATVGFGYFLIFLTLARRMGAAQGSI